MTDSVVLLHGLARTSASMRTLERALAHEGYRTLNLDYDSLHKSLDVLAEQIHPPIERFAARYGGRIHFLSHSMGGLLARLYLSCRRPPHLGRVVMLGPPNDGSALADMLHRRALFRFVFGPAGQQLTTQHAIVLRQLCGPPDYEIGVIAGTRSLNVISSALVFQEPNDGKVSVRSTHLTGMGDHIKLPVTHTFMMRSPAVVAATLAFLRGGIFPRDPRQQRIDPNTFEPRAEPR